MAMLQVVDVQNLITFRTSFRIHSHIQSNFDSEMWRHAWICKYWLWYYSGFFRRVLIQFLIGFPQQTLSTSSETRTLELVYQGNLQMNIKHSWGSLILKSVSIGTEMAIWLPQMQEVHNKILNRGRTDWAIVLLQGSMKLTKTARHNASLVTACHTPHRHHGTLQSKVSRCDAS